MPGRFEVYRDATDSWQFRLRARDGRVVALNAIQRHPFDSSDAARLGCEAMQAVAPTAPIEERH